MRICEFARLREPGGKAWYKRSSFRQSTSSCAVLGIKIEDEQEHDIFYVFLRIVQWKNVVVLP